MSGFFKDEAVGNKAADEPWKRSETDKMLDSYFHGAHPVRIAQELGRNPKAVKRRLEQFTYNERGWVERYEPIRRLSRKGKKLSENEQVLIQAHIERDVPRQDTARLLARPLEELTGAVQAETVRVKSKTHSFAPTLDVIWALRYAFFAYDEAIVSDEAYDHLVHEEIEYGGGAKGFAAIKTSSHTPQRIKSLAMYLVEKEKK